MDFNKIAKEYNHGDYTIGLYEKLKQDTMRFKNDDISELDIIYHLPNILWSANFELVVRIIKECGYESRLKQWMDKLNEVNEEEEIGFKAISLSDDEGNIGSDL